MTLAPSAVKKLVPSGNQRRRSLRFVSVINPLTATRDHMKCLIVGIGLVLFFATPAFAREEMMLVRITGYWRNEGCGEHAAWSGARLRVGDCAVDPKKIPYGSKIVFPDTECVAVDTGPAVVSRKSARYCGRTVAQRNALVIDRFFETKRDAVLWTKAHSQFITVRVITPESKRAQTAATKSTGLATSQMSIANRMLNVSTNTEKQDLLSPWLRQPLH